MTEQHNGGFNLPNTDTSTPEQRRRRGPELVQGSFHDATLDPPRVTVVKRDSKFNDPAWQGVKEQYEIAVEWVPGFSAFDFPYIRWRWFCSPSHPWSGAPPQSQERGAHTLPIEIERIVGWGVLDVFDFSAPGKPSPFRRIFYLCPQDPRDSDPAHQRDIYQIGPTDHGDIPPNAIDPLTIRPGHLGEVTARMGIRPWAKSKVMALVGLGRPAKRPAKSNVIEGGFNQRGGG